MRITRIAIRGFGALANVEIAWPEGTLLLVVDPNESGKTTFCEAVVSALYGLPHGRVSSARARERRRPRSGAPLAVAIEVSTSGRRLRADRELEKGTLHVRDFDRETDVTSEFARGAGRDLFGESVTGLTEALFRTTAYVAQNVLDSDELSKGLTLELARIADSGGGEASVVRALDALEAAAARMPDALSGPSVSIGTEVLRLSKRIDEKRAELAKRREVREGVRGAAQELLEKASAASVSARSAALLELGTVEAERCAVEARLAEIAEVEEARADLSREAERLAIEAKAFTTELLSEIEAAEKVRGARPAILTRARQEEKDSERRDASDAAAARQDLGSISGLGAEERRRLDALLAEMESATAEEAEAEKSVAEAWAELEKDGTATDIRRLDAVRPAEREFLAVCDEERHTLELEGVRCDRRAAEAQAAAGLAVGERRGLVKRGRGVTIGAGLMLLVALGLFAARARTVATGFLALAAVLGVSGAGIWLRGTRHLLGEERRRRAEEADARRQATEVRKRLSELRSRLDRIARDAGFGEGPALARALRRLRAAEPRRADLLSRTARREAARERLDRLRQALTPFRELFGAGDPTAELIREFRQRLGRAERAFQELERRDAARAAETERLAREEAEVAAVEARLADLLARAGVPRLLPLADALRLAAGAREKLARRREILEVELPARSAPPAGLRAELEERERRLAQERDRRLALLGASASELGRFANPEEGRHAAEAARRELGAAEEARRRAEKTVAARLKEGGERAREAEEELYDLEEGLRRATGHRDALLLAREGLSAAAAGAYDDFRRGLAVASREILASWDVPYAGLEFDDRLAVSAILRDGRRAAPEEIATGFSTGAREQIHLTARLAALRYLGTGARGVPLLLDDPLVAADDERFVSVMRFLLRNVLAERPVLVVSCHAWRHEQLLSRLTPEERERVTRVSLRSEPSSIDGVPPPE